MKHTVDYFITKFESIPEELWNTDGNYVNEFSPECKCALGHCGLDGTSEAKSLISLFCLLNGADRSIPDVNDGVMRISYKQPTAKQRILAALKDIKEIQNETV